MRTDGSRGLLATALVLVVAFTTYLAMGTVPPEQSFGQPTGTGAAPVAGSLTPPRSISAYPTPTTAVPSRAYPYPTGAAVTPAARATRVVGGGQMTVDIPLVPTPPSGGQVQLSVALAPAGLNVGLTRLTDQSRLIRALFVELSIAGTPTHDPLPQPATVTFNFTSADLQSWEDPLRIRLYLSTDGLTWEELTTTQVTNLGNGNYRAVATVTHFSFVALGTLDSRILLPVSLRAFSPE